MPLLHLMGRQNVFKEAYELLFKSVSPWTFVAIQALILKKINDRVNKVVYKSKKIDKHNGKASGRIEGNRGLQGAKEATKWCCTGKERAAGESDDGKD